MTQLAADVRRLPLAVEQRNLPRGASHPFSLWISLVRNPLRTLPMMLVTLVASLGIASIVVLADSLIRTALAPNDFLKDGLVVRGDAAALDTVELSLRGDAAAATRSRLGPVTFVRGRIFQMDSYFPVLLVADGAGAATLARFGDRIEAGRLPANGTLEIAVPAGFASGRSLAIGDVIGGSGDYTPFPLKIVGLTSGPKWIAIGSTTGVRTAGAAGPEAILITQPDVAARNALEQRLSARVRGGAIVQHWTPREDGATTASYDDDLTLMLGFIMGINAAVLSMIGGLLAFLYFRQRQGEFILLSILGRSKWDLARRTVGEIAVVVGAGWLVGIGCAMLFMRILQELVFSQRAIIIDLADPAPLLYTFPLALCTVVVSAIVTGIALLRFDPIARLQARG